MGNLLIHGHRVTRHRTRNLVLTVLMTSTVLLTTPAADANHGSGSVVQQHWELMSERQLGLLSTTTIPIHRGIVPGGTTKFDPQPIATFVVVAKFTGSGFWEVALRDGTGVDIAELDVVASGSGYQIFTAPMAWPSVDRELADIQARRFISEGTGILDIKKAYLRIEQSGTIKKTVARMPMATRQDAITGTGWITTLNPIFYRHLNSVFDPPPIIRLRTTGRVSAGCGSLASHLVDSSDTSPNGPGWPGPYITQHQGSQWTSEQSASLPLEDGETYRVRMSTSACIGPPTVGDLLSADFVFEQSTDDEHGITRTVGFYPGVSSPVETAMGGSSLDFLMQAPTNDVRIEAAFFDVSMKRTGGSEAGVKLINVGSGDQLATVVTRSASWVYLDTSVPVLPGSAATLDTSTILGPDSSGRISQTVLRVALLLRDLLPPVIGVKTPAPGENLREARPPIELAIADWAGSGIDNSTLNVYLDGSQISTTWNAQTGWATHTPAQDLAKGEHVVTATVSDLSGNTSALFSTVFSIVDYGIVSERTARTITYANLDGTSTTVSRAGVMHFQDSQGVWKRIDSRLIPTASGFTNVSGPWSLLFAPISSSGDLAKVSGSGWSAGFRLQGSAVNRLPQISGAEIRYPDLLPSTDVTYRTTSDGLKELLTLKERPLGAPVFRFPLNLSGVTATTVPDGSISFRNGSGEEEAFMPKGVAFDSSADPSTLTEASRSSVEIRLVTAGGSEIVEVEPDWSWLSDPSLVYPVYIDPDIKAGRDTPGGDAYISNEINYRSTTYNQSCVPVEGNQSDDGHHYINKVGYQAAKSKEFVSVAKFDLGAAYHKRILTASWNGYLYKAGSGFKIWPALDNANLCTVDWNTRPNHRAEGDNPTVPSSDNQWSSMSVTEWVKNWSSDTWPNYGFIYDTAGADSYVEVAADEMGNLSEDSYLAITWEEIEPTISSVTDSPDPVDPGSSITFSVSWSDPYDLQARAVICKTNGVLIGSNGPACPGGDWAIGNLRTSPSTASYAPSFAEQGITHNYWAFACDPKACSSSKPGTFRVNNPRPSIQSAGDSPDPVQAGDPITFSVGWTDQSDSVRAVICKTNQISSSGTCPGGAWSIGNLAVSSPATAQYTARARDVRTAPYDYFAHACDTSNGCSSSMSGTFKVDPGSEAVSDETGLEDFYPYHPFDVGSGSTFVNVSNGNHIVQYHDLDIPGQGLGLNLVRTYNGNRSDADGPLGKGWSLGLAGAPSSGLGRGSFIDASSIQLIFDDSDGTRHTFVKQSNTWRSPPGVNLVVTDEDDPADTNAADGINRLFKVYRPDGVRYEIKVIDGEYRLYRVADRKGNTLTFAYLSGKVSTITDVAGRTLTFTWWTNGYISKVRFTSGTSTADINYSVDDTTGQLSSVTEFPSTSSARTTTFSYQSFGLSSVTDGRSKTTSFAVDGGKVSSVTDREGKTWTLTYGIACGVEPGPTQAVTCLTNPGGHNTTWITEQGNLIERRDAGDVDDDGNARVNSRTYTWINNRLRQLVDEAQNVKDYEYNANGQVTLATVSGQGERPLITKLEYQSVSEVTALGWTGIAGVADLTHVYAATALGGSAEAPDERHWQFQYDSSGNGNLVKQIDPLLTETGFAYFERGLLKSVTNPRGAVTQFGDQSLSDRGYDPTGVPRKITDPKRNADDQNNYITNLEYDFMGRLKKKTDREGGVWSYEYDLRGNLLKETDPLGKFVLHCYDLNDNEEVVVRQGAPTANCSLVGTDGWSTRKTYDGRELLLESKTASQGYDGASGTQVRATSYGYYSDGELRDVVGPRGADQKATYLRYPNNRLKAFVDELGKQTDLRHTPDGLVRTVIDPPSTLGRHLVTYAYTKLGQVKEKSESGVASPAVNEYNLHGQVIAETTPMGRTTHHTYDKAGRLKESTNAMGHKTLRGYDDAGNLTSLDQPTGLVDESKGVGQRFIVSYGYNLKDELETETDPHRTISYEYDKESRQTFKKDKSGSSVIRAIEQKWRSDGRVSERNAANYSGGSATNTRRHRTVFDYDDQGSLKKVDTYYGGSTSVNVSTISATYTSAGELKTLDETIWPTSGSELKKSSTFTYHPDGLIASRSIDGLRMDYTYKLNGLEATTVATGNLGSFTSEYYDNGALRKMTLENNATVEFTYDFADRVTQKKVLKPQDAIPLSLWDQITYDDDGNRISEVATQYKPDGSATPNSGKGDYKYDKASRLIVSKHPFEQEGVPYALDDAGNVLSETGWIYTYDRNRLTEKKQFPVSTNSTVNATYDYDGRGNRTSDIDNTVSPGTNTTIQYDAADHTDQLTRGDVVAYRYDGLDRQVRRMETIGGTAQSSTLFFRAGLTEQIALETENSTVKTRYILDSTGEPLAQVDATKSISDSAGRQYFVTDTRGNLTQLIGYSFAQARGVNAVFSYDAYGRDKPALTSTTRADSRLRFQLAPRDRLSKNYAIGPRMLDPATYRFIGVDSVVDAYQGIELQSDPLTGNRYLYAGCNSVNLIDDGHRPRKSKKRIRSAKYCDQLLPSDYRTPKGQPGFHFKVDVYGLGNVRNGRVDWNFFVAPEYVRTNAENIIEIFDVETGKRVFSNHRTNWDDPRDPLRGTTNHGSTDPRGSRIRSARVYDIKIRYAGSNGWLLFWNQDQVFGWAEATCRTRGPSG